MSLLIMIERYLRWRVVPPSRFGREAIGDPRFVFDLRRGRETRAEMATRVLAFIKRVERNPVPARPSGASGVAACAVASLSDAGSAVQAAA
jgi:hypothetical protein